MLSSLVWKPQVAVAGDLLRAHVVPVLQYSYEGDEYGDTELDFSVVWDGDFPIDKPATFRGEGRDGAEELASWDRVGMSWGQGQPGAPLSGPAEALAPRGCSPAVPSVPAALLYKCWAQRPNCGLCLKADPRFSCGWCISEHRCQLRAHCPAPKTNWMHPSQKGSRCSHPRIAQVSSATLCAPDAQGSAPALSPSRPALQVHPLMGPKEGGTRVTIVGENLGLTYREVGLRVAGVRCNSIPAEYVSAER